VTPRAWREALVISATLLSFGQPLAGQTEGSLGMGASLVEFDGFLSSTAFVFAPTLKFDSPRLSFAGQGSLTMFESGRSVLQGNAAAAWLAGSSSSWRLELSGSAGASEYAGESLTGHLLAGGRVHFFGNTAGGWLGANIGANSGVTSGLPVEMMLAGWSVRNRLALVGNVAALWQGRARHFDFFGAARWTGPGVELEGRAGARRWMSDLNSGVPSSTEGFGEVTALLPVRSWIAVSVSGGKFLSDPVRGTLGALYVSAGLRLRAFGRPAPSVPVYTTGILHGRRVPTDESGVPLEILDLGDRRKLRVTADGAASVELMADFTDWLPVSFVRVAPGRWELELAVPAGTYRVNIRRDGGPWSVPAGARVERTEFGGEVGIVVVP
jgi:hypothetical protein